MARTAVLSRSGLLFHVAHPDAGDVQSGYLANGDPWVSGPIMITGISPNPTGFAGPASGAMVDPNPADRGHGYDAVLTDHWWTRFYREELNVAIGIRAGRPLRLLPGQRLVATESMPGGEPVGGVLTRTKRAAVLTVLARPPAAGAFRPPYAGPIPARTFLRSEMRLDLLPKAYSVAEPTLLEALVTMEHLWLDHATSWPARYLHPRESMPEYGREIATAIGDATLLLCGTGTMSDKAELAARVCQFGIDSYAIARGGGSWFAPGGHSHGRHLPILIAGLLLGDEDMLNLTGIVPRGIFGEDTQPYYMANGLPAWNNDGLQPTVEDWYDSSYRYCCTANAWIGMAAATRMLGLDLLWPGPWLGYIERYLAHCRANSKPDWQRAWDSEHEDAWRDVARDDLPGVMSVGTARGPRLRLTEPPHAGGSVVVELVDGEPGKTCWLVGGRGRRIPATRPDLHGVSLVEEEGAPTLSAQVNAEGHARWSVPVTLPAGEVMTMQAAYESAGVRGPTATNAVRVKVLPAEV